MDLRHDAELEDDDFLIDLGNQVAEDKGIDLNEKKVVQNEHGTVDGVTRKIQEGEQEFDKEVAWLKWVPKHTVVMTHQEIQEELKEKRKKEDEKKTTTTKEEQNQ